ncbi:molybdopterin molybdotransferase MoeA [Rubrobacter aplysinae]|uniref:molybdopterin molybdotransferase MoeA n=1 Tax=Rubrobacter aplysinae TaxID=909625 RepID=UPI00064C2995|nr:gephyrin-like molybdotransferase Glp [Rubrobacter aplysinae]
MQTFGELIDHGDALGQVLQSTPVLEAVEPPLSEAQGLVLEGDLYARFDSPMHENSAMDGFALRSADAEVGRVFPVVDEAPAGSPATKGVGEGEAVKVFTGGVIPEGADAVVPVENTSGYGAEFELKSPVRSGANVRGSGEDVREGELMLSDGAEIGPSEIALAASQGYGSLPVRRRPRVVVFSTGTELVEPGSRELSPGEVYDSNSYALLAQAREAGAGVSRMASATDDPGAIRSAMSQALESADIVVTSGGVSMGERDLVKEMLLELGVEQRFWGIKLKPGKPVFYGTREDVRFFGLPGNPVSAMVCFELFVRPAISRMMGRREREDPGRPRTEVYFDEAVENKFGRTHAMRVSLTRTDRGWRAESVGAQGSGLISSLTKADALAMIGPECEGVAAGEPVEAIVLRPGVLTSPETPAGG